jgi:Protein of unknown function (DUF1257)
MSCIFVVTPFVVGNWGILSALVGGAAAQLGYRMARTASEQAGGVDTEQSQSVELELENSEVMADQMRRGDSMVMTKGEVKIVVSLDGRGHMTASVTGPESIPKTELEAMGQEFIDSVIQQYAYQKVMNELKNKGFSMVQENVEEDGRITLKVRKFE